MTDLTQDSLAILALTNRLYVQETPSLKASEMWRLLDRVSSPGRLLGMSSEAVAEVVGGGADEAERLVRLLDTGVRLALKLGGLLERGIFPVTVLDGGYPHRLRERLGVAAPPVLYCAGDLSLLESEGIGLVGSAEPGPQAVEAARSIARTVVSSGVSLVSGAGDGVERIAMTAANEAGGRVVGVLADSLETAISRSDIRRPLIEGIACLCTPYSPMAPFSANAVIGRSKIVYGLSGVTIVVTVVENQGATWAGATEALDKHFGRVMVWMGPGAGPGNGFLVPAGAIPVDRPELVLERH